VFQPLRDAIAAQYESFRAPRPGVVRGCACCTTPKQLAALVAAPREALGPAELDFYARKAMTTVGTSEDFRYYWPRVAELAIRGELLTDTEVVFGKPLYGAHYTWPLEEQRALTRLATALGERLAAEELEPSGVDMWACAIGLLSERLEDPRGFLRPLLAEAPAAWANLRSLLEWNREDLRKKRRLTNAFWENAPASASFVLDWITSEPRAVDAARALALESAERYGTTPPAS
jgi:hypothetical protein